jgi:hypothetical protein
MDVQPEQLHFEMTFSGGLEDVFVTIRPKSHHRFEAWVEVRGVEMYCWVFKDELRNNIPEMLMPYIERCYKEAMKIETLD